MKCNPKKVSVIIPVYNVEEYIGETLDSILNQTLTDIEIILVNDGSTDNSQAVINTYKEKYDTIISIEKENAGPGIARNKGLDIATGEFIKFVDSDDILPFDALESEYKAAMENNADVVIGATYQFNSTGSFPMQSHYNKGIYTPGYKTLLDNPEILYTLGPCNKLYKREVLSDCRFPEGIKVTEDQPFVLGAFLNANQIYTIDKVIYYYRVREETTNTSLSQLVTTKMIQVLTDIFNSLAITTKLFEEKIPNKFEREFILSQYHIRLAQADIWPALRRAIDSKDEEVQCGAFEKIYQFAESLNVEMFNAIPQLHFMLTKWPVDRYLYLTKNAKLMHLKMMKLYFAKSTAESHMLMKKTYFDFINFARKCSDKNTTRYIYQFLAKRRYKRLKKKINNTYHYRKTLYTKKIAFNFAKMLPVQKNAVVLASNKSEALSGNLKFIHDEIYKQNLPLHVTVYTANRPTVKETASYYYRMARAKYIVLDDYYRQIYGMKFKKETEIIQVWHACGAFKKFGFSAIGYGDSNTREFEENAHGHYTKVVASSSDIIPHYAEAFNIDKEKVIPLGVPRTDAFFNEEYKQFMYHYFTRKYPILQGKKIITYAPTFRGSPKERRNFKLKLELSKMIKELGDEYVIILKMHPSVANSLKLDSTVQNHVVDLSSHGDVNDILLITDILISDYSSLVFEYSLLERPMIFFAYDLDNYLGERNFYYDYQSFVPGPIVKTTEEIIEKIKENKFDYNQIVQFRNQFFEYHDGRASERFVNELLK